MPGILVVIVLSFSTSIDLHQSGMVWIAAGNGMVLELTKVTCKGHVLNAVDVLVAEE
jgi:hypothetical protein